MLGIYCHMTYPRGRGMGEVDILKVEKIGIDQVGHFYM